MCKVGDQQTIRALRFVSQDALEIGGNKFHVDVPDDGKR